MTTTKTEVFKVKVGYARDNREFMVRNPADVDEMDKHCTANSHIWLLDRAGKARQVKVNGQVRRWKRDRTRIEVPFKYGLYEYGTLTASDIGDVLIEV